MDAIRNEVVHMMIEIVALVIPVALAWLMVEVRQAVRRHRAVLEAKLTDRERETLHFLANEAVDAVEVLAKRHGWDSDAKRDEAIAYLVAQAARHNIALDEARMTVLVEQAVLRLKQNNAELR